jgi:hypothetical protein
MIAALPQTSGKFPDLAPGSMMVTITGSAGGARDLAEGNCCARSTAIGSWKVLVDFWFNHATFSRQRRGPVSGDGIRA